MLKLIVWPKSKEFPPQEIKFELGKLNVITGASRTGKSAIIPIIDYCLASSDCNIPIDTIRDHASWYGILIQTDIEQILISRRIPLGTKASNDFYIIRGDAVGTPASIEEANEKLGGIKNILNEISQVPSFSLDGDEYQQSFSARLGFRDLMSLVFQNQDIVANQNILFYKTHAHEHRERLRNWFPFILGAENIEVLIARQRLQDIGKRLERIKREYAKVSKISMGWIANLKGHIEIAREYGLTEETVNDNISPEDLLAIAKQVLENVPENSASQFDDLSNASREVKELEEQEDLLSGKIGAAKKRLSDIRSLKSGLSEYSNTVKKRIDRLHISQWFEDLALEAESCPACGSREHPRTADELKKISSAFKQYEDEAKTVSSVPTSFSREEESVKKELEDLLEKQKSYRNRYDLVLSRDKKAQEDFQKRKNMFIFLGHLKASAETFESLTENGELKSEINELQKEYDRLDKIVDLNGIKRKVNAASIKVSQGILDHLKTLDVEEKYKNTPPEFSVRDLNIKVLSSDKNWHFLAEVGSASNWVSFHIALMCSLQEYFLNQKHSCVPNFVIFDQPSQVYFPKVKRGEQDKESDFKKDVDVEAVKKIFKTIAGSIASTGNQWQSIILDHADESIYGDIEDIHEVAEWRSGKKLIPIEWYED